MNLYLISQDVNNEYDTYDSCVVACESEDAARVIHPGTILPYKWNGEEWIWTRPSDNVRFNDHFSWVTPDKVKVTLIGTAIQENEGVICASFNAG